MSDCKPLTLLTPAEVADRLRLSRRHLYRLIKSNELVALRTGRKLVIPERSIQVFLSVKSQVIVQQ